LFPSASCVSNEYCVLGNHVELTIYNIKGQKVNTLKNEILDKGSHSIIWNGVNESGNIVSSGIYMYKLKVNGRAVVIKKCILLK